MKLIMFIFLGVAGTMTGGGVEASQAYSSPWRNSIYPAGRLYTSWQQTPNHQQYGWQDGMGQYGYGYKIPSGSSVKEETRSADGNTRGYYSYRDGSGKLQTTVYRAGSDGFHVASTNLPQAPGQGRSYGLPQPVQDTPEVALAKADHLRRFEQVKLRDQLAAGHSTDCFPFNSGLYASGYAF